MLSLIVLALIAAAEPADTECTVTPGNIELFDPATPTYKRTQKNLQDARETFTRKDGVVVTASAFGCAHVGVELRWANLREPPATLAAMLDRALAEIKKTPFRKDEHLHGRFLEVFAETRGKASPKQPAEPLQIECGEFATCVVQVEKTGAGTFTLIVAYDFAA